MNALNIKTLATLAATLIAASAHAGTTPEKKCGAGSCSKKTAAAKASDAACGKKDKASDATCSKKEKDASCSKKDASCSKK
jgi:hypothetical protein